MEDTKKEILVEYIKKYTKKGYSEDILRRALADSGYSDELIDSAFIDSGIAKSSKPKKKVINLSNRLILKEIFIVVCILVVIVSVVLILLNTTADCGYDKVCFAEKANNCENSVVRDMIANGSIVRYTSKGCAVIKTIEKFSEEEPEEVVSFFEDKEMTCTYEQYNFDEALIENLVGGIDTCSGNLKDAIYELRLAS